MPLDRQAAFQLGLLLLAVPLQFLIANYLFPSTSVERQYALKSIYRTASVWQEKYLSWKSWQKWCAAVYNNVKSLHPILQASDAPDDDQGESPAVEVLNYRNPEGQFASSTEPRYPRPPHIKFRVGQVIRHKKWGYRGVIVGWDPVAKAPENWLRQMHPPDKKHWRDMPNYSVLVDTRDRLDAQSTYVVEENIEIISNEKIVHPKLDDYFEAFDGAQYIARPWLRTVYPQD